ncbi:MAG: DUF1816 domain-containing protein [Trichocoleus desertorum ATA4-8-CV12]|jgi:hypothetical protein|nr:DUF1816 domain-containing protein [Trichocoleus desertorum ATA4-8-CV12]
MKEVLISLLETLGLAFWVEIVTDRPRCTYYFGPFLSSQEAQAAKSGYVEDLEQEGAQGIRVTVKRCKPPADLTISDDLEVKLPLGKSRILSGQF